MAETVRLKTGAVVPAPVLREVTNLVQRLWVYEPEVVKDLCSRSRNPGAEIRHEQRLQDLELLEKHGQPPPQVRQIVNAMVESTNGEIYLVNPTAEE